MPGLPTWLRAASDRGDPSNGPDSRDMLRRQRAAPSYKSGIGSQGSLVLSNSSIHDQRSSGWGINNGILLALLAALLVGVLTFDRSEWPSLIGDEATYLMTAESLAFDGDLEFERHDYDRFLEHWRLEPEGLILQSGDAGGRITFGKPFFYPLWMVPFVRLSPMKGPFLANFLILGIAAIVASGALRKTLGAVAPLWVACSLFASVAFAYTFWAHADLFLLALTAIALSLAFWEQGEDATHLERSTRPEREKRRLILRWAGVGALLAVVVFSRPFYLPLFLPVVLALPRRGRWRAGAALLVGAVGLTVAAAVVHRLNADAWTSYGAQRRGFYSATGFPGVQFPAEEWQESLDDLGDAAWAEARTLFDVPRSDPSLWLWNGVYFSIGRYVGVLPYFLPVLLGLFGRPRGASRRALLIAVGISVAGFFLYRPFNIYGGGGAMANRYFMPLFPAFWFMASRPCRLRRIVAIFLVAAPFLWPLWRDARSFPMRSNHTYRYVSTLAARTLPFETTQSHLKPAGRSDVLHGGLWVKFLTPTLRPKRDGTALLLDRGSRGQLLLGTYEPLEQLELRTLGDPAEIVRVVDGATVLSEETDSRGRVLNLLVQRPRARHPMWWTWHTIYLYELTLESETTAEGRITFRIRVPPDAGGEVQ